MDPARVSAVTSWPIPDSRKQLQWFLGFANFYRRFIRSYSTLAAPLTVLTSSKVPFQWSTSAEKAFLDLKTRFTSGPILQVPDPERQFIVEVDASKAGQGPSCPSKPPVTRNSTPVPSFLSDSPQLREIMTLGTESCWL